MVFLPSGMMNDGSTLPASVGPILVARLMEPQVVHKAGVDLLRRSGAKAAEIAAHVRIAIGPRRAPVGLLHRIGGVAVMDHLGGFDSDVRIAHAENTAI